MNKKNKPSFSNAYSLGQLADKVRLFLSKALSTTRHSADKGLNCLDNCSQELKAQKNKAVQFVARNPKQSAVVAAGVGAALLLITLAAIKKSGRR